ncbi:hypothetical protein [Halococcus hamelinensis]|uniref:Uncharacterized protein n=1 Tax=Halococcus hamelinensis 100A6 TaxID=1132509 RepID=M0M9K3_9EURY|nr:hypothetical protein [Halococcus hamelinensis]EMA41070.1 hypothetical protein C447_02697 [Halococcus hamelinensis 100A6]
MDLENRVAMLEAEARKRWGERWAIHTTRWADGDHQAWAFSTMGLTKDGDHAEHRIYLSENGEEAVVERITTEDHEKSREVIEVFNPTTQRASAAAARTQ